MIFSVINTDDTPVYVKYKDRVVVCVLDMMDWIDDNGGMMTQP